MSEENNIDETVNFITSTTDLEIEEVEQETETGAEPKEEVEDTQEVKQSEVDNSEGEAVEEESETEPTEKPEVNDGDNTETEQPAKKSRGVQKRINKIIKEREAARREVEQLKAQIDGKKGEQKNESEGEVLEPKESDFPTYDEYLDALESFETSKEETAQKEEKPAEEPAQTEQAVLTEEQQVALAVIQDVVANADKPSDFDQVALDDSVPISPSMLEAIAECDNHVDVMYHLGKNKDFAAEIASKTPAQQMRAIAKLDLTVKPAKPAKPIKTTQAKDPIQPIKKASSAAQKDVSEMSFAEYEAYRNKQEFGS